MSAMDVVIVKSVVKSERQGYPNRMKKTSVDLNRCIGCGLCIPTCPQKAMSLKNRANEVGPPQTRDDLYDIIMSHKKGSLGKLKIMGKIVFDAIRTGQTHLLR